MNRYVFFRIFSKMYQLFNNDHKKNFFVLVVLMTVVAAFEVIGIISIFPFLSLVTNQELIFENRYYRIAFDFFGASDVRVFTIAFGLVSLAALLISLFLKVVSHRQQIYFSQMTEVSISSKVLKNEMLKTLDYATRTDIVALDKLVLSEVAQVVSGILLPTLTFISQGLIAVAIIGTLLVFDPSLTVLVFLVFAASYGLIAQFFGAIISRLGSTRYYANAQKFRIINVIMNSSREISSYDVITPVRESFDSQAKLYARATARAQFLGLVPRYYIDGFAFGGAVLFVLYAYAFNVPSALLIPKVGIFALSAYKILPSFQYIYNAYSSVKFSYPALHSVHSRITYLPKRHNQKYRLSCQTQGSLIKLENITLTDQNSGEFLFRNLNFTLDHGQWVAITGASGVGKSTLIDVMINARPAEKGDVLVRSFNGKSPFIYVPQKTSIIPGGLDDNIAFYRSDISPSTLELTKQVVGLENLSKKIELAGVDQDKWEMSGGERQRIAIARAIAVPTPVLIFDEATNALDKSSQRELLQKMRTHWKDTSCIFITHDKEVMEMCDRVYELKAGKLTLREVTDDVD